MLSRRLFFIQAIVVFMFDRISESVGLSSDNDTTNWKSVFLITFGSGLQNYSKETPSSFNFSATYQQRFENDISDGTFAFVNKVPDPFGKWHREALDHTPDDVNGYMYLVNVGEYGGQLFNFTANNLYIGSHYEFSAYLSNVIKIQYNLIKPNVRFEVRTGSTPNHLLAQINTTDILQYDIMNWSKYGVSFVASSCSVVLLMISNVEEDNGNDLAIDDIELRVCSEETTTSQQTLTTTLNMKATTMIPTVESTSTAENTNATSATTSIVATTQTTNKQPTPFFIPQQCHGTKNIGTNCDISSNLCDMLKPCQNNGTCNNTDTIHLGYSCSCAAGFNGTECQFDHRPCKPNTCWNNGTCTETSNTTFNCSCAPGWEGLHCEIMNNYCKNITCENKGVCRPLLLNYTCECGDSYYGRHCEFTAKKIIIFKIVSKSFAYMAIIAMVSVVMFVVIMDILKYCFGIDPVRKERERIRREKRAKRRKRPVIQRFIYVNAPSKTSEEPVSTI